MQRQLNCQSSDHPDHPDKPCLRVSRPRPCRAQNSKTHSAAPPTCGGDPLLDILAVSDEGMLGVCQSQAYNRYALESHRTRDCVSRLMPDTDPNSLVGKRASPLDPEFSSSPAVYPALRNEYDSLV